MKTKTEKELEREILQDLYDKGMIDFEGDEDGLTMQVPTNIIEPGQFVVDVYKEGMKKAREEFNKKLGEFEKEIDKLKVFPKYYIILKDKFNKIFKEEKGK